MTIDLYTATDVKKTREKLLKEQEGLCKITGEEAVKPCLDHAHDENQLVRGVLSHGINIFVGQIENAYKRRVSWWCKIPLSSLLRKIADYLDTSAKENRYRHPKWLAKMQTEYNKLSEGQKRSVLASFDLPDGRNTVERKKLFQSILKSSEYSFEQIQQSIKSNKEVK
jgi:Recombination endonuclease VII